MDFLFQGDDGFKGIQGQPGLPGPSVRASALEIVLLFVFSYEQGTLGPDYWCLNRLCNSVSHGVLVHEL